MIIYSKRIRDEVEKERVTAELARCKSDPLHFINTYVQVNNLGVISALEHRQYQQTLVMQLRDSPQLIVKAPRQAGLSTLQVAYALWKAIFHPDKPICYGSANHMIAFMARDLMHSMWQRLPKWLAPAITYHSRSCIQFSTGCRVHFDPITSHFAHSLTPSLVVLDCFAYVAPSVQVSVMRNIVPAIAHPDSQLVISSTPNARDDEFAQLWGMAEAGLSTMSFYSINYWDLPIASQHHWHHVIATMGDAVARREYNAEFV